MSQTGKLTPNLDHQSTKLLNLTVLQRIDPYIEEILITAAHVTFYGFNIDLNQWSRKDVEGSLFVVKRNTQPRFQFIVMNRRNTDNLVENILDDFEYEIQVPYLLYRNASQEVNGIWFYHSRECEDVANLFSRILDAYAKVPSPPKVSPSKSEFEEFETFPTPGVTEGPPEPSFTANTDRSDESSFVNFFSRAMNMGHNTPNVIYSGKAYHSSATTPPSSSAVNIVLPSPAPPLQTLPFPLSASSTTQTALYGTTDPANRGNQVANLVKPSTFFALPSSSSALTTPPFSSSVPTQHVHGTPLLQPFPPPAPPPSLTPSSNPTLNHVPLNREKVGDALLMLVQDNQFIDMFYQALLKVQQS